MMTLVLLLSSDDDFVVMQTLLILTNLVHFGMHIVWPVFFVRGFFLSKCLINVSVDMSREIVRTYIEPKTLASLTSSANVTVKNLANSMRHMLGL